MSPSTNRTSRPPEPNRLFVDGVIHDVIVDRLTGNADARGWLTELFRADELPDDCRPAMGYLSQTAPGIARGPHEHSRQTDCFVFLGPGIFEVDLWDARQTSPTYRVRQKLIAGARRSLRIVVPPGVVHAYVNLSAVSGWVLNFPNQLYRGSGRKGDVDEIRHESDPHSPYVIGWQAIESTASRKKMK